MSDRDIKAIGLAEVARLHEDRERSPQAMLLIDPRSRQAYERAHLPGARHLELSAVPEDRGRDPAIDRYELLVVYGDNPGSVVGRAMTKRLMSAGYKHKKVRFFEEGIEAWMRAGLRVEGRGE